MATTEAEHTRAEQLEARARKAMAAVPKARGWDTGKVRADELRWVDVLLDAYNDEVRG